MKKRYGEPEFRSFGERNMKNNMEEGNECV